MSVSDQDMLGKTGSMAELHDLLISRGFFFDSCKGSEDDAKGFHQVGYVLIYKSRQGDVACITLIEKGTRTRRVHKVISPNVIKIREAGTADTYEISHVVSFTKEGQ